MSNVGLWHICLAGYVKPRDPLMESYVGCWWIHSTFFEKVWDNIMPPWFRAVQALVIFTVLCNLLCMILMILFFVRGPKESLYGTRRIKVFFIEGALLFAAAFFVLVVSLVFAEMGRDPNWMPRPWLNYLSWSYGFNTLSGFFSAFGGICILVKAMLLRGKPPGPSKAASREVEAAPSTASGSTMKVAESFL
ncbi:hypothetical protein ScPMuIL_008706 [Solemya velum]